MLSIIIPVYNERNTINKIINKINKINYIKKKIIIVDDGSTDGTREIIKKNFLKNKRKFKVIFHKTNLGKGGAIKTAKKYIMGKYVIIQDADLEYDPRDYKKIIKELESKKFKVVYGSRVLNKNRYFTNKKSPAYRVFANHMLTIFSNLINNQKLTDAHTCYKAFDINVFRKIKLNENGFNFCPEITTKISNLNMKIKEVQINYYPRSYSDGKKISVIDGFEAIWTIIKYKIFKN